MTSDLSQILNLINILIFSASAIYLIVVDIKRKILPNKVVYPLLILTTFISIIISFINKNISQLLNQLGIPILVFIGFVLIYFIYPSGFGMGDIKVILLIGIVLSRINYNAFIISLAISFGLGLLYSMWLLITKSTKKEFVFGPFLLIPAVVIALLNL